MPLDTSIYNQLGRPQVALKDFGEMRDQAQMRQMQQQQMQMQQQRFGMDQEKFQVEQDATRRALDDERTLSNITKASTGADGKFNRDGYLGGLGAAGKGKAMLAAQKEFAELDGKTATAKKTDFDMRKAMMQDGIQSMGALTRKPDLTYEDVQAHVIQRVQGGLMDPQDGQAKLAEFGRYARNPEAMRDALTAQLAQGVEAYRQIELNAGKTEIKDTGAGFVPVKTDGYTGKVTVGDQLAAKQLTPGERQAAAQAQARLAFDKQKDARDQVAKEKGQFLILPDSRVMYGDKATGNVRTANEVANTGTPLKVGAKVGAEQQRQIFGAINFDKTMGLLGAELDGFDPRNPADQLDPTKRARIASLSAQALLQGKEAAALGALTGPDLKLMYDSLGDATGGGGVIDGVDGLREKIKAARAGNASGLNTIREKYGVENVPELSGAVKAPAARPSITPGTAKQGYVFLGGDPADKNNWKKQ